MAFVHNLFGGAIAAVGRGVKNGSVKYDSTRYTPIHMPHRTEITGFMSILHGDVRFYNNVFVQQPVRHYMPEIKWERMEMIFRHLWTKYDTEREDNYADSD